MLAVILAAGSGSRLGQLSNNSPKCLIKIGNKTLIEYSLQRLADAGIKKAVIVIGYLGEQIKEFLGDSYLGISIKYVVNENFLSSGTMYSFYKAKNLINDDVLLFEADLLYDNKMINKIFSYDCKDFVVVSKLTNTGDEVLVSSGDGKSVLELGKKIEKNNIVGEFIGVSKLSKNYMNGLFNFVSEKFFKKGELRRSYEECFLDFFKDKGNLMHYFLMENLVWTEIDTETDLEYAKQQIFPKLDFNLGNKKRLKKVLLINPSNTMPKDSVRRLATPLGLLYLGAVLKGAGYDVNILDSTCDGYYNTKIEDDCITYGLSDKEVIERIKECNPDVVGVTSMFSAHQENALDYCKLVKKVNKEIPVVLGGIHPSLLPEHIIEHNFIDYLILGEGEYRLLNLINDLNKGKKDFEFDGIAYKKNGEIKLNPMISRIENLDELGLPARDLVDIEKYIKIGVPFAPFARKERVEQIMTTRGCPGNCVFCSAVKLWGRKFRMRSVESVMQEISELVNKYNVEEIQFADDNLTINKERAMEIFKRMEKYNLSWCTPNGIMIQTLDKEMIEAMAKSGAYQLSFAIESGSQRVLREIIDKRVPEREKVKELIDICHANGISVHGMLIIGFLGETKEEMYETLEYPFGLGLDSASYFIVNPLPGSRLYEQCKEKGYLSKNAKMDFKTAEINVPEDSPDYVMSKEELVKLVDDKTKEFNEFSKKRNPVGWDLKFKKFLEKHGDKADLILGRVT